MRVDYICAYYSQNAHENIEQRTQDLWDAYKFCGAVKSRTINGYCTIPRKPKPIIINSSNVGLARKVFGRFIGALCENNGYDGASLVPAPSKDSFSTDAFRSRVMVEEACPDGMTVIPAVRFMSELKPSSQGGPRGYVALYPHMQVVAGIAPQRVVLVDDILTSGGTLLAAHDRLVNAGFEVLGAIACGRTTDIREKAFKLGHLELGHESPDLDFQL